MRLETRAGEFTAVASLRGITPEGVGKPTGPQPKPLPVLEPWSGEAAKARHASVRGGVRRGPGAIAVRPETERSRPG